MQSIHKIRQPLIVRILLTFILGSAISCGMQASEQGKNASTNVADKNMNELSETLTAEEIALISSKDDLHIAPFREDGKTYGTPTWIWNVEVDGKLFVRAYNGTKSSWYQAAVRERAGKIEAAGMVKKVRFQPISGDINDRIDDAYRAKYSGSRYLKSMISERTRAATVQILPGS